MANSALECGLLDSEWTGRNELCQAEGFEWLEMETLVVHVVVRLALWGFVGIADVGPG